MPKPKITKLTPEEITGIQRVIANEGTPSYFRVWRRDVAGHTADTWFYYVREGRYVCYGYLKHSVNSSYMKLEFPTNDEAMSFLQKQSGSLERDYTELDLTSLGLNESTVNTTTKPTRRYVHTEDGHNKFWEISMPNDMAITTKWGKIGTSGQSKTKNYSTKAMAVEAYMQLYKSKEAKGYKLDKIISISVNKKISDIPHEPTATEEGLCEALDILDLD